MAGFPEFNLLAQPFKSGNRAIIAPEQIPLWGVMNTDTDNFELKQLGKGEVPFALGCSRGSGFIGGCNPICLFNGKPCPATPEDIQAAYDEFAKRKSERPKEVIIGLFTENPCTLTRV